MQSEGQFKLSILESCWVRKLSDWSKENRIWMGLERPDTLILLPDSYMFKERELEHWKLAESA